MKSVRLLKTTLFVSLLLIMILIVTLIMSNKKKDYLMPKNEVEMNVDEGKNKGDIKNLDDIKSLWDLIHFTSAADMDFQIKGFADYYGARAGYSGLNEIIFSFYREIFNPENPTYLDTWNHFQIREKTKYDDILIFPEYHHVNNTNDSATVPDDFVYLTDFSILSLKNPIMWEINNQEKITVDEIALYHYNDTIYLSLYKDKKYLVGHQIVMNQLYYVSIFKAKLDFIEELKQLMCNEGCY